MERANIVLTKVLWSVHREVQARAWKTKQTVLKSLSTKSLPSSLEDRGATHEQELNLAA